MGKKIRVTKFGLCERCARREKCEFYSDNVASQCGSNIIGKGFKDDPKKNKEIKLVHKKEVEDFLSTLTRTDRKQIQLTADYSIVYFPKEDSVRRFNSRSNTTLEVPGDEYTCIRFCENCGAKFHTVNRERRLCDECHEEICEKLGVCYANEKKFKMK